MKRRRVSVAAIAVVVGIAAITVVSAGAARRQVSAQEEQKLRERSGEVALTLAGGLSEIRSSLSILANLPVGTADSPQTFEDVTAPLVTGGVRSLVSVEAVDGRFVVRAASGEGMTVGTELTGARAELAGRAVEADDVVSAVVVDGDLTHLVFGLALTGSPSTRIVLREVVIDPSAVVETVRNEVFSDLDIALYAGEEPDPAALVMRTSETVAADEHSISQSLPVGSDPWLLVTASRGQLVSSFTEQAPWAILGSGLLLAVLLGVIIETLARRSRYAEALVAARTADLERSLAEGSRLEQEARKAGAEAEAANRSKSEFLSRMSHELRTPLNAVMGFAQLLDLEPLSDDQRESVHQISKGGRHLLDLINEVLDIARIETGDLALSTEPVDASEVVAEVVQLMGPIAEQHGIRLVRDDNTTHAVHVFTDRQRLKQILLNLISNGIKYNRVGGWVSLHSGTDVPGRLRINVTDTGIGVAAEDIDRLFEPFDRVGAEHSDVPGTGIGLALSRGLAEAMGGSIGVDSTQGRGSTFWVELPVVEGPVERFERVDADSTRSSVGPADGSMPARSVLLIEDNLPNVRLVQRIFEHCGGLELIPAMQGRLGVELAQRHRPLVVLLDLHLPDMDGEEVLRELRADPLTASIPVIILSAEATPGRVQRLLAQGAHAYLTKPLDVQLLLDKIDELGGLLGVGRFDPLMAAPTVVASSPGARSTDDEQVDRPAPAQAVIIEEWAVLRSGVSAELCRCGLEVLASTADLLAAGRVAERKDAQLIVLGALTDVSPGDGLRYLRSVSPGTDVIVLLASSSRAAALELLDEGAAAVVGRDAPDLDLRDAVLRALRGDRYLSASLLAGEEKSNVDVDGNGILTERERAVLHKLISGLSNRQIADALFIGEATVKTHLHRIYDKLEVANRVQAVGHARERGLIAD